MLSSCWSRSPVPDGVALPKPCVTVELFPAVASFGGQEATVVFPDRQQSVFPELAG
jgi:hypothetical protein